ncbi:UNVERIFIED_CONTAM: hypothetical protein Q9R58_11120 [Methylobacteriaceae bacterium AG10]|nr:hypothetical protein [Methylobacteriaceae bacterium AG10]
MRLLRSTRIVIPPTLVIRACGPAEGPLPDVAQGREPPQLAQSVFRIFYDEALKLLIGACCYGNIFLKVGQVFTEEYEDDTGTFRQ